MAKYRQGQQIVIIGNKGSHPFKIGEFATISSVDERPEDSEEKRIYCIRAHEDIWWVYPEDITDIDGGMVLKSLIQDTQKSIIGEIRSHYDLSANRTERERKIIEAAIRAIDYHFRKLLNPE